MLENIIRAMRNLGGKASYSELYAEIERITGEILTKNRKAYIRACVETHSSDSDAFKGDDIFYSVCGKGQGIWGLRIR